MQMLFQVEMSPQDAKRLEAKFWKSAKAADTTREFANALFEGASKDVAGLDEVIAKHADNWRRLTERFCDWEFTNCGKAKRRTKW